MQRSEDTHEKVIQGAGAGAPVGQRATHPPTKASRATRKSHPRRPGPLGTDAKSFNDEIPDPDGELTIPE